MPPRKNPLKLNPLQLKTLILFQALAHFPDTSSTDAQTGEVTVTHFPKPHGDHFHIGGAMVQSRDATGITNQAVWNALERKGLARSGWPKTITLTKAGLEYETGVDEVFHRATH